MAVDLIVIGASLGGLAALRGVLQGLPPALRAALVIVQHRGAWESGLCSLLAAAAPMPLAEPDDKERVCGGRAYLAPADYHLLVDGGAFALSTEGRVGHARPSIDVLFDSAARAYQRRLLAIVLTGASADGALGARRVKERGGLLVVQDPDEAECRVMPQAAVAAVRPDAVLPLGSIAALIASRGA